MPEPTVRGPADITERIHTTYRWDVDSPPEAAFEYYHLGHADPILILPVRCRLEYVDDHLMFAYVIAQPVLPDGALDNYTIEVCYQTWDRLPPWLNGLVTLIGR